MSAPTLPRWADIEQRERTQAHADAATVADPVSVLEEGFEPVRLRALDNRRTMALAELRRELDERKRAVQGELSALGVRAGGLNEEYHRASVDHAALQDEVSSLERRPSQRPGDGLASAAAIGGGPRRLRALGWPALLLGALLAVEAPVFAETALRGLGSAPLAGLVSAGAVLILLGAPYVYGRRFRAWQEEGKAARFDQVLLRRPLVVGAPPVLWLALVCTLLYLRLDALDPGDASALGTAVDGIGLAAALACVALLLALSAAVAAELGRRTGSPVDARLRDLRTARDVARARLDRVDAERARLARERTELGQTFEDLDGTTLERFETELNEGFDQIEAAYVQTFMQTVSRRFRAAMTETDAHYHAVAVLERHRAAALEHHG